jgi:Zn-dependent protease with chaperone function
LARSSWPLRAPRAAVVLWQSIALAAVLSAFSAGIAIASRLFVPGPDGRPTATITSEIKVLGWPLWLLYVVVFTLTLLIGARLVVSVVQVAIATRRRRAHHRMVVDLVGRCHGRSHALRILDVSQPLAYCLPGVRSRVVVSEGTLSALDNSGFTGTCTLPDGGTRTVTSTWTVSNGTVEGTISTSGGSSTSADA